MTTRKELLSTTFPSAYAAMKALEAFLQEVDSSWQDETRANHQDLRVIGNKIVGNNIVDA